MNKNLVVYLQTCRKIELKWMYHFEVEDLDFGMETDKYRMVTNTLEGYTQIDQLIEYFERYYSDTERIFIDTIKKLMTE